MRQDFTLAIRSIARNPIFAAVSIFTIALGIGLNTSVFGIVNVLLFRPPSLDAAHELIWVLSASTKANGPRGNMTYPDVEDLRTLPVLAGVVAYGVWDAARLALIGLGAGIGPAMAIAALLAGSLVGVGMADPAALTGVVGVLTIVTIIAAYVPARRASRIDPLAALRSE